MSELKRYLENIEQSVPELDGIISKIKRQCENAFATSTKLMTKAPSSNADSLYTLRSSIRTFVGQMNAFRKNLHKFIDDLKKIGPN